MTDHRAEQLLRLFDVVADRRRDLIRDALVYGVDGADHGREMQCARILDRIAGRLLRRALARCTLSIARAA